MSSKQRARRQAKKERQSQTDLEEGRSPASSASPKLNTASDVLKSYGVKLAEQSPRKVSAPKQSAIATAKAKLLADQAAAAKRAEIEAEEASKPIKVEVTTQPELKPIPSPPAKKPSANPAPLAPSSRTTDAISSTAPAPVPAPAVAPVPAPAAVAAEESTTPIEKVRPAKKGGFFACLPCGAP